MPSRREDKAQKRVRWNQDHLSTIDHSEDKSYLLTDRQANALLTVIRQMKWSTRWEGAFSDDLINAFASEIAYRLMTPTDCEDCTEYPAWASLVEWFPNNPFTEPNLIGDGYLFPAWYVAGEIAAVALGAHRGAAITSLERVPLGSLPAILPASGLPRFRINVNGKGTVEIHLDNLYAGGLMQVTVDDDIGSLELVDTNIDIIALPQETEDITIIERTFDTDGAHWIDCIVVPTLDDAVVPLLYGGGLVKVVLCGFVEPYAGTGGDLAGLAMRLNVACEMEFSIDGGITYNVVQDWALNADACFLGAAGATGIAGTDGNDGTIVTVVDGVLQFDDDGDGIIDRVEPLGGSAYPTAPDVSVDPSPACGAAFYTVAQLRAFIVDLEASTVVYVSVFDAVAGFFTSALVFTVPLLISTLTSIFGGAASVLVDFDAQAGAMREELYCNGFDKGAFSTFVRTLTSGAAIADYLDCVGLSAWQQWYTIGSLDLTQDCSAFCAVATPIIDHAACYYGGAGLGTLVNIGGNRWQGTSSFAADIQHAVMIVRDGGGCFRLDNIVTTSTYNAWQFCGGACGSGSSPPLITTSKQARGWTGNSAFVVEFDFIGL